MCRIANDDEGFGLVTKHYGGKNNCGRINDLGIQYVNEANKNKVHLDVDKATSSVVSQGFEIERFLKGIIDGGLSSVMESSIRSKKRW